MQVDFEKMLGSILWTKTNYIKKIKKNLQNIIFSILQYVGNLGKI